MTFSGRAQRQSKSKEKHQEEAEGSQPGKGARGRAFDFFWSDIQTSILTEKKEKSFSTQISLYLSIPLSDLGSHTRDPSPSQRTAANDIGEENVIALWELEAENAFEVRLSLDLLSSFTLSLFLYLFSRVPPQLSFPASATITVLERIPGFIRGRYQGREGWFQVREGY